jgi:hypothetical protein
MANSFGVGPVLSRDAAFVVHLTDGGDAADEQAHGRVEHVRTGRSAHFDSLQELLRFMRQTLAAIEDQDR